MERLWVRKTHPGLESQYSELPMWNLENDTWVLFMPVENNLDFRLKHQKDYKASG